MQYLIEKKWERGLRLNFWMFSYKLTLFLVVVVIGSENDQLEHIIVTNPRVNLVFLCTPLRFFAHIRRSQRMLKIIVCSITPSMTLVMSFWDTPRLETPPLSLLYFPIWTKTGHAWKMSWRNGKNYLKIISRLQLIFPSCLNGKI